MGSETKASEIDNKPYMQVINYRIGKYTDFRNSMLDAVNRELPKLSIREGEDYGIALMEMWAYLADILAYYQERIANEAFIRTAVLKESIIALSDFVDYRLDPGVAATTFIALIANKGKSGIIPKGFRVQSKAEGELVKIFQTDEAIMISSERNMLKLVSEKPYQQLKPPATQLVLEGTNLNLKVGNWILILDDERDTKPESEKWELRQLTDVKETGKTTTVSWSEDKTLIRDYETDLHNPRVYVFRETAWPFGSNAPDYSMIPPVQRPYYLFSWNNVPGDESNKLKDFLGDLGVSWAGAFQFNNDQKTISVSDESHYLSIILNDKKTKATLVIDGKEIYEFVVRNENNKINIYTTLIEAGIPNLRDLAGKGPGYYIYLDSIYEGITAGSYIAAVKPKDMELYRVTKTYDIVKVGFGLSSKVTVAVVDTNTFMRVFKLRETVLLCANEELKPVKTQIDTSYADTLNLEVKGQLSAGAYIAISGEDKDGKTYTDVRRIVDAKSSGEDVTTIVLDRKPSRNYRKDSVVIYGNVVPATFGEPVRNEILGSGNASISFQRFTLKKTHVTFLPDPAAPPGEKNSLELSVDNVLWKEVQDFIDSGPKDTHYVTEVNEKDEMSVIFGDGVRGAKLPTGKDNIIAKYSKGVGGNALANTITDMVDSSSFLESVLNPVEASGGAEGESAKNAKESVSMKLHTFERAVSLEDYAYLAKSFSGVVKARSEWEEDEQVVNLTVALQDKELDSEVKKSLRTFLDMRRDTSQKLRIEDCKRVEIELALDVNVKSTYFNSRVKKEVERVLGREPNEDGSFNYFTFERMDFGVSIHLSDIYAIVEGIDGVESLKVNKFKRYNSSEVVQDHVPIKDKEIAHLKELLVDVKGGVE